MARKIGLVLGAGGIRGCAHAGVVAVLAEAGITPDIVVGASIGSMFGLGIAAGLPAESIAATGDARPIDIARFYAGRLRPSRTNPIGRMLLEAGAGKTFADLEKPFAVLATDIDRHESVVLDEGPVLPAVQASIAVPFVARPVRIGDRAFLDGGLLDTLPVYVARRMGADIVIGVCLGTNFTTPEWLRRRPWTREALARFGRARGARMMEQARFFARLWAQAYDPPPPSDDADVTIRPDLGTINPNSMAGALFCFQQGIRSTREVLPRIQSVVFDTSLP